MKRAEAVLALLLLGFLVMAVSGDVRPPRHRPVAQAHYLEADGLRIRVAEQGRGPVVVLVHGYGESLVAWRDVMNLLASHHRTVALDLPGFGMSDKPDSNYTAERLARIVTELIRQTDSTGVVLVGHSMGGEIAALAALAHPELVRRLVLIDAAGLASPLTTTMRQQRNRPAGAVARKAASMFQGLASTVLPIHDPAWLAEPDSALAYQPSTDPASYAAVAALLNEFDFTALEGRLAALRIPTLVIWGEHDALFPLSFGERFAREIPDARLVVIPRSFHRPHATRPEAVARATVEYLHSVVQ